MEYVKYIVLLILSLIGIVNIIKSIIIFLCKDDGNYCKIIIPLDDNCENPETVIRNIALYHEWSDKKRASGIYCIYEGENEESKKICRRVCEDYPFVHYITYLEKSEFYK